MNAKQVYLSYIGGPTALLELGGQRMLTDPTLDPANTEYPTAVYILHKRIGPSFSTENLLPIDTVLLSHDHHFDNLDHAGRDFLRNAGKVLTTKDGAQRLGRNAVGLSPWETVDLSTKASQGLKVTATPARHGPEGGDRGPVIGFVVTLEGSPEVTTYISGDTVLYDGVVEVARRFTVRVALLFMGAARVKEVGPSHLTFTAEEAVEASRLFADAIIVPLHYEGWDHYSESRRMIDDTFRKTGLDHRLRWIGPGRTAVL